MTHRAETILEAVKDLLTNLPTTGRNVERDRFWPAEQTPALSIEMGEEEPLGDFGQLNTGIYDERLVIDIVLHVKTLDGLSTTLNAMVKEIFQKLSPLGALNLPYVEQLYYTGRDKPENAEASEQPTTMQVVHWAVHYRHSATDPSQ